MAEGAPPRHLPAAGRALPTSTYRLQLTPDFGFDDAVGILDHLARLGVSHVYLSPMLASAPGSTHGYDVIDPTRLDEQRGGPAGFRRLVEACRAAGLGIVVDIVPNHVSVAPPESGNPAWWSLLSLGRESPYAPWFDVDWEAPGCDGRVVLPVLGASVSECLVRGELWVDMPADVQAAPDPDPTRPQPVLRYHDHVFPLRRGTETLAMPDLLARQHYLLAYWRDRSLPINYRRFFDVSELAALRVEDPEVFAATHDLVAGLVRDGAVDGLRVDHPDGLADPGGYLDALAAATGGAWTVAEKILTGDEPLPPAWACAGTTGYDAAARIGRVLTDPAGQEPLDELLAQAGVPPWREVLESSRREVLDTIQAPETDRLARLLAGTATAAGWPVGEPELTAALHEILVAFPVYRAYPAREPDVAAEVVGQACAAAARRRPELADAVQRIGGLVLDTGPEGTRFAHRFGQTTAPLAAKGGEDRAFYRWPRLLAHVEVGADPERFALDPDAFHAWCATTAREWPATMTTLTTHDTKRSGDVRARLLVLTEMATGWAQAVQSWQARAEQLEVPLPDPPTLLTLWQTLVGVWPAERSRLLPVVRKMLREAGQRTSWLDVDDGYERQVLGWVTAVLADPVLSTDIDTFVRERLLAPGRLNGLASRLLAATMPGVPDTYQGGDGWDLSLVDPDNRRPVDWTRRRTALSEADRTDAGAPASGLPLRLDELGADGEGLAPARVLSQALRLRREHPEWFGPQAGYRPVSAEGPAARHLLGFARGGDAVTLVTRLPVGLSRAGGWRGTTVALPDGRWVDRIGGTAAGEGPVPVEELLGAGGVALLVRERPA